MRVLFFGTGEIGLPTLEWLLSTPKHEVVAIVTQPDKPVGRKLVLTPPQVKVRGLSAGIPILQPVKVRLFAEELQHLKPDIAVVVAYGQILPKALLELPRLGCLNLHASLLPKFRGASPIQAAIREGEAETGMTIMYMDEGLDTGDVLLTQKLPIEPQETGGSLHDKLALLGPKSLEVALDLIESNQAPRQPQNAQEATHCGKLKREDGHLQWSDSAAKLERLIRAYQPWPGTHALYGQDEPKMLKISAALPLPEATAASGASPGTILAASPREGLIIQCGEGLLSLLEVQAEGGKRLLTSDFLRGHPFTVGLRLF